MMARHPTGGRPLYRTPAGVRWQPAHASLGVVLIAVVVQPAQRVGKAERVILWAGAGLAAIPPLLGLTFVLMPEVWMQALFYNDAAGASAAQAVLRMLTELVMSLGSTAVVMGWQPALLGLVLILVGLSRERRSRWFALAFAVVAIIGLAGGSAAVLGALFPESGINTAAVGAAVSLLFWVGLVALVVLALRRLRPSAPAWAIVGTVLVAAVLLGVGYLTIVSGALSWYTVALSMGQVLGNFLGLAVGAAVVLWIVASRTRTLRLPVALGGGLLVASWIILTVLRLAMNAAAGGAGPGAVPLLAGMLTASVAVAVIVLVALVVLGVLLARRTRTAAA